MRFKLSLALLFFFALSIILSRPTSTQAQEGEATVIDEVVAQVNDDVITLSMLKREIRERVEVLMQDKKMTEQQANDEVMKHQAELIATLINERLLLQKGKELDLASQIEAEVNSRMLDIAREQGINSIAKLEDVMRQSKIDPVAVKETMRTEMMKQAVMQQEVDRPLFLGFRAEEVKSYFEAHKDQFRKPESISLSEIYLSTADKDDAAVKARAVELVTQLRAGADFKAVASANSEREKNGQRTAPQDGGKVGTFEVPNLRDDLVNVLKDVKVGGVSDPIKAGDGYQILRIDERTPAGTAPVFNDNMVRQALLSERSAKEHETYLVNLRNEAYIKVTDVYRADVEPLLKIKAATAAVKTSDKDKKKEKKP
ncbi:MAG TPA: peptidyl-prolyl cis-trans isomerase [Pyrinomonadaceae bacterium]|nr:peptidyl-prolyl cis-trans isomerase [Pyrinomonadaceae bacterium]